VSPSAPVPLADHHQFGAFNSDVSILGDRQDIQ
jgi:hypothetical protein